MIVFPIMIQPYVKKEDVRDIPKSQNKFSAIVLLGIAFIAGIMQLSVFPKLLNMYEEMSISLPFTSKYSVYISGTIALLSLIGSLKMFTTEPDYSKVDEIAKKYKDGEMIKTKELMANNNQWVIMLILGLFVGYLVVSIIQPIYTITSQL